MNNAKAAEMTQPLFCMQTKTDSLWKAVCFLLFCIIADQSFKVIGRGE